MYMAIFFVWQVFFCSGPAFFIRKVITGRRVGKYRKVTVLLNLPPLRDSAFSGREIPLTTNAIYEMIQVCVDVWCNCVQLLPVTW